MKISYIVFWCREIIIFFFMYLTCVTQCVCVCVCVLFKQTLALDLWILWQFTSLLSSSSIVLEVIPPTENISWFKMLWLPQFRSSVRLIETSFIHKNASIIIFSVFEGKDQSACLNSFFCLLEKECIYSIILYNVFVSLWKYLLSCIIWHCDFCPFVIICKTWFVARWKEEAWATVFLRNRYVWNVWKWI